MEIISVYELNSSHCLVPLYVGTQDSPRPGEVYIDGQSIIFGIKPFGNIYVGLDTGWIIPLLDSYITKIIFLKK